MAIVPIGSVYRGESLSAPTQQILYFPLLSDGTITDIQLKGTGFNAGLGNWLFNVSVAGVNVFSGVNRITFNSGVNNVTKTGLSVAGSKGDVVVLNLEQSAGGVIQTPLSLIITFDDGEESGGGSAYLPDIAPTSPHDFNDEFDGGSLSGAWSTYGNSDLQTAVANGSLTMSRLSNSNGQSGIYKALPADDPFDWITKVIFPHGVISSGQINFSLAIFDNAASTSAEFITAALVDSPTTVNLPGIYAFTNRTTFDSTIETAVTNTRNSEAAMPYACIYLRVERAGNAYKFYRSLNGIVWFEIGTGIADITSYFAPSHIGFLIDNTSGATRDIAFVDWTRIYPTLPVFMGG